MNKTSSVYVMIHYICCKCIVLPHAMQQASSLWNKVTFGNCSVNEVDIGDMMLISDDLMITFVSPLILWPSYSVQHSNTL